MWIYNSSSCKHAYGFLKDLGEQLAAFEVAVRYVWSVSPGIWFLSGWFKRIQDQEWKGRFSQGTVQEKIALLTGTKCSWLIKGKQCGLLSLMLIGQFSLFFLLVWNKSYWSFQFELSWHLLTCGRRYSKLVVCRL